MRNSRFITLVIVSLLGIGFALFALGAILPGLNAGLHQVGRILGIGATFLIRLVLLVVLSGLFLGAPWGAGYLAKSVGVDYLDENVDKDYEFTKGHAFVLGIVGSVASAVAAIAVFWLTMNPWGGWNWLYRAMAWMFDWAPGVWETASPFLWFSLYWFIGFFWIYMGTKRQSEDRRY